MYKILLRPLLFLLDPEASHRITLVILRAIHFIPGMGGLIRVLYAHRVPKLPTEVMGIQLDNPVGLAAGFDKDARYLGALSNLGFGFIELGTVTPRPQPGNPRKRLFRIPAHGALINRMGFNNAGVEKFLSNLSKQSHSCRVGVNIGKHRDTPLDDAVEDYLQALRAVYGHADYVTVNISSPNTPGLRELQDQAPLERLLRALKNEQITLARTRGVYMPVAVKISPDLDDGQIENIAKQALEHKIDAVIATNTTLSRPGMDDVLLARETGGLSGRPLSSLSTAVIRKLYTHLQGRIPIIGVGGVFTADDAWEKLVAGADLIQVYTGFVYEGPSLVRKIVRGIQRRVEVSGETTFTEALAKARSGVHLMR